MPKRKLKSRGEIAHSRQAKNTSCQADVKKESPAPMSGAFSVRLFGMDPRGIKHRIRRYSGHMAKSMYLSRHSDVIRIKPLNANYDGFFFCRDENSGDFLVLIAHEGLENTIRLKTNEVDYLVSQCAKISDYDTRKRNWPQTIGLHKYPDDFGKYSDAWDLTLNFRKKGAGFFTSFVLSTKEVGRLLEWLAPRANWELTA